MISCRALNEFFAQGMGAVMGNPTFRHFGRWTNRHHDAAGRRPADADRIPGPGGFHGNQTRLCAR